MNIHIHTHSLEAFSVSIELEQGREMETDRERCGRHADSVARRPHTVTGVRDMVSHPSPIPTTHFPFSRVLHAHSGVHCLRIALYSSFYTHVHLISSIYSLISLFLCSSSLSLHLRSLHLSEHLLPVSLTLPNPSNSASSFLPLNHHVFIYSTSCSLYISLSL